MIRVSLLHTVPNEHRIHRGSILKETTFHDPADLPEASAEDHPADHVLEGICPRCNHEVDAVCPHCDTPVEPVDRFEVTKQAATISAVYRRMGATIAGHRNGKFLFACILIATGDAYADGISMSDIARRWGVTRATVSKHCRIVCREWGIPPSPYMLREEAGAAFRASNRRNVSLGRGNTPA